MPTPPAAPAPASAPAPAPPSALDRYLRLWLRVPRELGYLLPILPLAIASLSLVWPTFWAGIGLTFVFVGLFVVLAALFLARGFGMLEVLRLRASGFPEIIAPAWDRKARSSGSFAKIFAPFIDGHYWLYLLWAIVVGPIVGILAWSIAFTWAVVALVGMTYWAWAGVAANGGQRDLLHVTVVGSAVSNGIFAVIFGILALLTLPFITRALTIAQWWIGRGMLGVFAAEKLQERVVGLSSSRTAAVAAEGTALRRLERDLHDGPQQRLVRLQMDLAAAERQLDQNPKAARTLIGEAMQQSKDALEELRSLSRGFAPPLLLDRGLVAALDSMASRSPLPVNFVVDVPDGTELPPELERNAYFITAEAITNAEKHANASHVTLRVGLRRLPDSDETWLGLTVSDDGVGGAAATPGHGIAGLEERLHGLGGILTVTSPHGGPTVVVAQLPVTSSVAGSTS